MVYSTGHGTHGFTLDPTIGEFLLSHPNIQIPSPGGYYSVNQGYEKYWPEGMRRYVRWLQGLDDDDRDPLSQRYIGSLIADVHRTLLMGGVFAYPSDVHQPHGKLRLVYEAQPLAFIAHHAGAYASDGTQAILDVQPAHLHERIPLFLGNRELVEQAERFLSATPPQNRYNRG